MIDYKSYKDKIKELEEQVDDLRLEVEAYKYCIHSITRVYKERENAKRGLYSKKEHSGYLLLYTNSIDYKFYLDGRHRIEKLYQVAFQTPYTFDIKQYDARNLIIADLLFMGEEDDDKCILEKLGAEYFNDSKRYEELLVDDFIHAREQIVEIRKRRYKEEHGYISYDIENEIRNNTDYYELKYIFNMDVRRNGKEGYWEAAFQANFPIEDIPKELRYRKGNKNGTKEKDVQ